MSGQTGGDPQQAGDAAPMGVAVPPPITSPVLVLVGFVICALLMISILVLPLLVGAEIYNNDLFRQISVVIVAAIIAFLTFGLLSGSTAGVRMNPLGGLAISLGGAVAGAFAFYIAMSDRLTPTTHMVVFVQSGGKSLPSEVDLTGDQMTARQIITVRGGRGEFQILARGQSTALEIGGERWKISGISPQDCTDLKDRRPYTVRAGCDQITLEAALTEPAKSVRLVDYTAAQVFQPNSSVSLDWAVEKLRAGAAERIHARNNTVVVNVEWKVPDDIKKAEFKPKSNATEVGACVLISDLQSAFNDANPDKRIRITVSNTTIEVGPGRKVNPMTIALQRRRLLLGTLGIGLFAHRAAAQRPYCQIPPAPASCYAECRHNTVLTTSCDPSGNQCRSSCDLYQPGQAPAQVLDGLTWRRQEGSLQPITKDELAQAMDRARDALLHFLASARESIRGPGFYWALFTAPPKEPPRFMEIRRAETSPPALKPFEVATGFTATPQDMEVLLKGDSEENLKNAETVVFRAHFG